MRRSLIAMAAVLLSGVIGGANERAPVVQDVIHATPGKIKKAALAMFVPDGYTQSTLTRPRSQTPPRGAGGLVSGAASKAVVPLVEASR